MAAALAEAKQAAACGEVPVGAVIVDDLTQNIIVQSGNQVETLSDPTAHAEIVVLRAACRITGEKYLPHYSLYVTLEPCAMCATAIALAHIGRLYFGAYDEKRGAVEHGLCVFHNQGSLYPVDAYGGIMEKECAALLREFFLKKR